MSHLEKRPYMIAYNDRSRQGITKVMPATPCAKPAVGSEGRHIAASNGLVIRLICSNKSHVAALAVELPTPSIFPSH